MATVRSKTSIRVDELIAQQVVEGYIAGNGSLILVTAGGAEFNAGNVAGDDVDSLWNNATAYLANAIVGYAGKLWKAVSSNTGKPPALFTNYWTPLTGADANGWSDLDPHMEGDDPSDSYETSIHGTGVTTAFTTSSGEHESGRQALKIAMPASTSQRLYSLDENIVKGGEVITCTVRAKTSVGTVALDAALLVSDAASPPISGGSGVSSGFANEGTPDITTTWTTFTFTMTAALNLPRAAVHLIFTNPAGATRNVFVDSFKISRANAQGLAAWPVGSVYTAVDNVSPALRFGGGTWSVFATGRMLIGVDTGDAAMNTPEETGGAKTHVLTTTELPPHAHSITHSHNARMRDAAGSQAGQFAGAGGATAVSNNTGVDAYTGNSGNGPGSSDPIPMMNPYITVYMWKRTA